MAGREVTAFALAETMLHYPTLAEQFYKKHTVKDLKGGALLVHTSYQKQYAEAVRTQASASR